MGITQAEESAVLRLSYAPDEHMSFGFHYYTSHEAGTACFHNVGHGVVIL